VTPHDAITDGPARSRERAVALRERLGATYGDFRDVEIEEAHDPPEYERLRERAREGAVGAVGAWITDDAGRVLLVHERDREGVQPGWTDPGGAVEPGESFEAAARREVREEAGVAVELTGVLELLWIEHRDRTAPERAPVVAPTPIFEADYAGGDPRPQPGETDDVAWFESPPESVRYPVLRERPFPAE
jgi:8-oxo-dGTP diphosphatase